MNYFFLVFLFVCFSFENIHSQSTDYELVEDQTTLEILTPSFKGRRTAKIKLRNDLEVYLVSDPAVDKSSATLVVKTGSWEDPVEYPGMAHFLEHMLFLGTAKYPEESEFDRFISQRGGTTNAFTTNEFTAYLFSVDNYAFADTLDRFASFFKEPLFNPSGVARELQAIDQEYAKNIENDGIREYYVLKELSDPKHPNHAFSMGNRASLLKVSQESLKTWYQEHYSANRMRLVAISNMPLEELKNLVVSAFTPIVNKALSPAATPAAMLPEALKGHIVYIEPLTHIRKASLIWELPEKFAELSEQKSADALCYILGHEAKKSLLAELKREKLAEGLSCGAERIGTGTKLFLINIDLTDAGVKNINTVVLRVFEALAMLEKNGIPQYVFDEMRMKSLLDYQYQSREDAFEHIFKQAMWTAGENLSTYPEVTQTIQKFNRQDIAELLKLLTPENSIIDVIAPKNLTGVPSDRKEQWLDVSYTVKTLPAETIKAWRDAQANPKIDLPDQNPYIPEKLSLVSKQPNTFHNGSAKFQYPTPTTILNSSQGKVYFTGDNFYGLPLVHWMFEIKTPAITLESPQSIVLGDLYVKNIQEFLNVYAYSASAAGLDFEVSRTDNGIALLINGYSDKAGVLFYDLIKRIKEFVPDLQKFKTTKASLTRQYQNTALENPVVQAYEILKSVVYKNFVTDKSKFAAIKPITFEQFEEFTASLFNKTYVQGMLIGNLQEEDAQQLTSQLISTLSSSAYPASTQPKKSVLVLPEKKGPYYFESKTKTQGNAIILAIEAEPFSFRNKAAQQILMQAMKQPFFSTLRTKQQTAYIALNKADDYESHLFDVFAVQSNTHSGRDLLARFELFIESYLQEAGSAELNEEIFNNIKQASLLTLTQPPKNLTEMGTILNNLAFEHEGDFDWLNKKIKGYEELAYQDFLEYSRKALGKQNKRRLAILLNGMIPEDNSLDYKRAPNITQIRSLGTFEGN